MNNLSIGITLYVEETGKTYHTLNDWKLALGNNNYIGEPEMETTYIQIPGRSGLIDASEVITGRRVFKKRQLAFGLGGKNPCLNWDDIISKMRNEIHGRVCRITLDNDIAYYWRGRVFLEDFDRFRELGTFTLSVPNAEPYKYSLITSAEPWLWDPFNFETGIITYIGAVTISGTRTITIPAGYMPTTPEIVVSDLSGTLRLDYGGQTYTLTTGTNKIPSILVGGDADVDLAFTGNAKVQIVYRSGSL